MSQEEVTKLGKQIGELRELMVEHIDRFNKHIEKSDIHIDQMQPIIEGMSELQIVIEAVKTSNSNFKFIGWVTSKWKEVAVIGAGAWAIIKLIVTLK